MASVVDPPSKSLRQEPPTAGPAYIPSAEERYQRAREHVRAVRGFYLHLAAYVAVNIFLLVLNLVIRPDHLWFYWSWLGWGLGVTINAVAVFGVNSLWYVRWEERKIREYMDSDR